MHSRLGRESSEVKRKGNKEKEKKEKKKKKPITELLLSCHAIDNMMRRKAG